MSMHFYSDKNNIEVTSSSVSIPSSTQNMIDKFLAHLLAEIYAHKSALLSLETQRNIFLCRTAEAQVLSASIEKERLVQQGWWQKQLFLLQASLACRVAHQRLRFEEQRAACGVGAPAHIQVATPLLPLSIGGGIGEDSIQVKENSAAVGVLILPLGKGLNLQCHLVANGDAKERMAFFEGTRHVPFILTHVSGGDAEADLSPDTQTIVTAEPNDGHGDARRVLTFRNVQLRGAAVSTIHTLLITHPRTKYGLIAPLEVHALTIAPPVITMAGWKWMESKELVVSINVDTTEQLTCVLAVLCRSANSCNEEEDDNEEGGKNRFTPLRSRDAFIWTAETAKVQMHAAGCWGAEINAPLCTKSDNELSGTLCLRVMVTLDCMPHSPFEEMFPLTLMSSTLLKNEEINEPVQSFRIEEHGVLMVPLHSTNPSPEKLLLLHPHQAHASSPLRVSLDCPIDSITEKWFMEFTGEWPLLVQPDSGSVIVLRSTNTETMTVDMHFSPTQHLPRDEEGSLSQAIFIASRCAVVRRYASGKVILTECDENRTTVIADDCDTVCAWEPPEDDEGLALLVLARHGRCFSVFAIDYGEVLFHSSLQVNAQLTDSVGDERFYGIVPALRGDAVVLWTEMAVELLTHRPTWSHKLLYTTVDAYVVALCAANYEEATQCEVMEVLAFLLRSDGTVTGLMEDGSTRKLCQLDSTSAFMDDSLRCMDFSFAMRHITMEGKDTVCICGMSSVDKRVRCVYVDVGRREKCKDDNN